MTASTQPEVGVWEAAVADRVAALDARQETHPGLDVSLLGHSRGAAPAPGCAIAHQTELAGLILSTSPAQSPPGRLSAMPGRDTVLDTIIAWLAARRAGVPAG